MSKGGGGFQPEDYRRNPRRLEAAALAENLLHPVKLAAENGNYIARSTLNARTLPLTIYIRIRLALHHLMSPQN